MKLMKNKMAGIIFGQIVMVITFLGVLQIAFEYGAAGGFSNFFEFNTAIFVIGIGWGMTFLKEHTIKKNQYGKVLKENLILSGWLGFITGLILMLAGFNEPGGRDNLGGGVAACLLSPFYGFWFGITFEAVFTKPVIENYISDDELIDKKTDNIIEDIKVDI